MEIEQIKAAQRTAWTTGDFGKIAQQMTEASEAFAARVQSAGLALGAHVLDVATGTGNIALPLALRGFRVTGVDIAPNLLAQARARAAEQALEIAFDEGDAEALPYPDASFDAVTTMFGAMFAPRPALTAAEMARVLRPGGLLAMGNWTPESFSGAMFRTSARHVPPPPGLAPATLWGDPAVAHDRLAAAGFTGIATETVPVGFRFPAAPAEVVRFFRTYFGPMATAFARLDESGKAALAADLEELWTKANRAADPESQTDIPNEYLYVTARRGTS